MRSNFQIWVNAVCEQVRFRPDHRSIEFELRDHYEEHVRDLLRLGRPRELAEERALAAMGDAQEVGRALDKVHKPWLGWLWEVSRWLFRALAVLTLVTLFWTVGLGSLVERTIDELTWEKPPASAVKAELEHGTLYAAPGDVTEEDGHTVAEVRLWMKMRDPLGTEPWYGVRSWFFTWRDGWWELSYYKRDRASWTWPESRYWTYNAEAASSGWTRFRQTVRLVLDEAPRWAEVSYPLSGQDWALRVTWEEEP